MCLYVSTPSIHFHESTQKQQKKNVCVNKITRMPAATNKNNSMNHTNMKFCAFKAT